MSERELVEDALRVLVAGEGRSPVLLTCEHASTLLPEGLAWPEADAWLVGSHWAWDPGAAEFTVELALRLGAKAVLARYSRLWLDLNREPGAATMFRASAEGREIVLNHALSAGEAAARFERGWVPFHARVASEARAQEGSLVFSIHSFTPNYEGELREMEVGVLFDAEEALALGMAADLKAAGYRVALNEPWSGKAGLMVGASRGAAASGRRALELELRQDLAVLPAWRAGLVDVVSASLGRLGLLERA